MNPFPIKHQRPRNGPRTHTAARSRQGGQPKDACNQVRCFRTSPLKAPVLPAARIQKHTVHHASAPRGQLKFVFHLHSCSQTHGYTTEPTPSHRNPMSSRKLERRGAYKTLWQSSLDIPLGEKLPMPLIFFIKARATDKTKGTPVCPELMTSHRDTSSPRSADTASLMLFLTVFE